MPRGLSGPEPFFHFLKEKKFRIVEHRKEIFLQHRRIIWLYAKKRLHTPMMGSHSIRITFKNVAGALAYAEKMVQKSKPKDEKKSKSKILEEFTLLKE